MLRAQDATANPTTHAHTGHLLQVQLEQPREEQAKAAAYAQGGEAAVQALAQAPPSDAMMQAQLRLKASMQRVR